MIQIPDLPAVRIININVADVMLVVSLLVQTGALFWWGAKITEKQKGDSKRIDRLEQQNDAGAK